jgi:hypothetical protein
MRCGVFVLAFVGGDHFGFSGSAGFRVSSLVGARRGGYQGGVGESKGISRGLLARHQGHNSAMPRCYASRVNLRSGPVTHNTAEMAAILAILVIFPVFFGLMYLSERSITSARETLLRQLTNLSAGYSLNINGRSIARPEILIAALKRIKKDRFNHSLTKSEEWYKVTIIDGAERVTLSFSQDKDVFSKCWVFVPGHYGGAIGTFEDAHLREYLAESNVRGLPHPGL